VRAETLLPIEGFTKGFGGISLLQRATAGWIHIEFCRERFNHSSRAHRNEQRRSRI
jgi:hypothetical protein